MFYSTVNILFNIILTIEICIKCVLLIKIRSYVSTGCTTADAVWYIMPAHLHECMESCVRQSACLAVNYNRLTCLCVLRGSDFAPTTIGNCYHITLQHNIPVLSAKDPCNFRPCDNRSTCESKENTGSFNCRLIYCDSNDLPDIPNARTSSRDPTKVGFTNAYQCDFGYTMFGDSRIKCLEDGSWSNPNLVCHKDCTPHIQKIGATIEGRQGLRFCYNTTVTYSCIYGYYNLTDTMTKCLSNGTWSPFECLKHCTLDNVPHVQNGEAMAKLLNTIHDTASYSCIPGYYKSTTRDSISCNKDGTWQPPSMECWKYCFPPIGPTYSYAEDARLNQYTKDMTVTFTCTGDYYPTSGDRVTTCLSDGTWTSMTFSCNRYCGQPPIDVGELINLPEEYVEISSGGGKEKYTTYDTVTYTCLHGASIDGNNQRRCGSDGYWIGNIKCCLKIVIVCSCCSSGSCDVSTCV